MHDTGIIIRYEKDLQNRLQKQDKNLIPDSLRNIFANTLSCSEPTINKLILENLSRASIRNVLQQGSYATILVYVPLNYIKT